MLHYGISGHFQALANVLKRRIKSVSPEKKSKKNKKQKVGVAGFDSLRNAYIYFFYESDGFQQKTTHLSVHFLRDTDIEDPGGCLDTALKFLTAKFVYSKLSLSLC